MNIRLLLNVTLCLGICSGIWWSVARRSASSKPVIAILQIASHAALDASRDAFIDVIREQSGDTYSFVVKNADGSVTNAQTIAQSLVSRSDVVAMYALGTPSLQALVQKESVRPILFSAVTYPGKLGLVKNNVAGASDYFDLKELVSYAHKLAPKALRVGILYNPGTEIAQHELSVLEDACKKHGMQPVRIAGVTEADILGALKSNIRKVDLCVVPTDNMIASVLSSVSAMCNHEKIPLIAAWQTALDDGVLAAFGMDYAELGKKVGYAAMNVLRGVTPIEKIGVMHVYPSGVVNKEIAALYLDAIVLDLEIG